MLQYIFLFLLIVSLVVLVALSLNESGAYFYNNIDLKTLASAINKGNYKSRLLLNLTQKEISKSFALLKNRTSLYEYEKWLYDNGYKVENALKMVRKSKIELLPSYKNMPRIYYLAKQCILENKGKIDKIGEVVAKFNDYGYLQYREITSFYFICLYALCEYLATYYSKSKVAYLMVKKGEKDREKNRVERKNLRYASYLYGYIKLCTEEEKTAFVRLCQSNGIDIYDKIASHKLDREDYCVAVKNAVQSLSSLPFILSEKALLKMSKVNTFLEKQEDIFYKDNDDKTKSEYLRLIAKKSKNHEEMKGAMHCVKSAREQNIDLYSVLNPPKSKALFVALKAGQFSIALAISILASFYLSVLLGIFIFIPMYLFVGYVCNFLCRFPPLFTPKVALSKGKALIVISALLLDNDDLEYAIKRAKIVKNANKDFDVCLLVDLKDATEKVIESDYEIIDKLREQTAFYSIVRSRTRDNDKYVAWEKKRGAIIELNEYLISSTDNFALNTLPSTNYDYVISLDIDSDIILADDAIRAIEHPFFENKSVLSFCCVNKFYANETYYSSLFCDASDGYCARGFSLENDWFRQGNYTGKGIYRIKDFHKKTANAFPCKKILSHDFIEGAIAGCSNCDITVSESAPQTFAQNLSRDSRWIRGDVQLIPYLFSFVKDRNNHKRKNDIGLINKSHILSSLLVSLYPIALLLSLVFARGISLVIALAFPIFNVLSSLIRLIKTPKIALKNIAREVYIFSLLPTRALSNLYAICITLFRLISNKNLLEWRTFRHSKTTSNSWIISFLFGVIFIFLAFSFLSVSYFIVGILFAFSCLSPLLDKPILQKEKDRNIVKKALEITNRTGAYFLSAMEQSPLYLVPDFYSEESDKYATMTSPTNIGFSLISLYCLYSSSLIKQQEYFAKTDRVIQSISQLKKYRGHLYNWYQISDGKPLPPYYVSTVDSGNLCVMLAYLLPSLSQTSQEYVKEFLSNIDFEFLFNSRRKLLATGFCDATKSKDESCYDLTASESLLTYLFCIGYGKIPYSSAFSLDNNSTYFCGNTLLSWTGGAFEYLMSSLFFPYFKGSSLYQSSISHVKAQMRYSVPFWGVSESGYNDFDDSGNRKYSAFGIDKTAYKSTRTNVKSPYSTFLSLEFTSPDKILKNLQRLEKWGMSGKYGYFESFDKEVIPTYMAHHQGMIMLALHNYLYPKDRENFAFSEHIQSALLYLLKPEIPYISPKKIESKIKDTKVIENKIETVFDINLLCGKEYKSSYSQSGESQAFCYDKCVYATGGNDIYLTTSGKTYSLLKGAKCSSDERKTEYKTENNLFISTVSITSSSSFDGEIKKVEITNKTSSPLIFTLGFYVEPVLDDLDAYIAHKTYSKMFIKSRITPYGVMSTKKGIVISSVLENCNIKEYDRGKVLRKSKGKICVDCCSLVARSYLLQGEEKSVFYSALICAKSTLLAQSLSQTFIRQDKNTLFESSEKHTKTYSVGERIKNTLSALSQKANKVENKKPCIVLDCRENKGFMLKEVIKSLLKISYFTNPFVVYILYREIDGYARKVKSDFEGVLHSATREEKGKNIEFIFLDENQNKAKVEQILSAQIQPITDYPVFAKKPLLIKKCEQESNVNLPQIEYETDCGGFYKNGFLITKSPHRAWSNIVANGNIGFISTEYGGGYTFYSSSRQEKITDFYFDPLKNEVSEGVVFCEDNLVWSATSSPCGQSCYCMVESGKTTYKTGYNGIEITQKMGVSGSNKFIVIKMRNDIDKVRTIKVSAFFSLVLGDFISNTSHSLSFFRSGNVLSATNAQNGLKTHLSCSYPLRAYSFSTKQMQGKNGEIVKVDSFEKTMNKDGFVYTTQITLAPNQDKTIIFSLGKNAYPDFSVVEDLIEEYSAECKNLSKVNIKSYDKEIDTLFPFLLPQTYLSRFVARCGFYQIGGAYGFRDQLQDCLALLYYDTQKVREHILYCAARQFESGDVLHWWHHPFTGVRTRTSDDRLFLPFVVAKYIEFTGDKSILEEQIPFLKDEPFEKVLYKEFTPTHYSSSLKEHLQRAIHSTSFAQNGLALMGDGDWNDAMDNAGSRGIGTSVWLSMFLYATIDKTKDFLDNTEFYKRVLIRLKESVRKTFDGKSFARLITDSGKMLGYNDGFIDIITQSWAVLSGICDISTGKKALKTAQSLVDEEKRIIKLLAPAFDEKTEIGSIGKYPKGVRENGGQYTHGALWYIMALYKVGEKDKAYEYLKYLIPSTHCKNGNSALYKNEPYVVSADVYESGEGGWSWYTGSSGWMYIAIVECMFGIKKQGDTINFAPSLPSQIDKAEIELNFDGIRMKVEIINTKKSGEWSLSCNGINYNTNQLKICEQNNNKKFILEKV